MKHFSIERKRRKIHFAAVLFFMFGTLFWIGKSTMLTAAPDWKQQEGADNAQGDQKKTGKTDTTGKAPVYGAIGNLDDKYSMDIDGDGTSDITIPEADLIEVSVTPSIVVNVYRKEAGPGEEEVVTSTSAEGIIRNQNAHNCLKVSIDGLEALDENAGKIKITDELDQNAENGLSLSIYAKKAASNAFALPGEGLGTETKSLANTAQEPPVPVTLGIMSEKGGDASFGIYQLSADCRGAFVDKYKDLPITYQAVYKFTIEN